MEFKLQTANHHDEEIVRADYSLIRLFQVKRAVAEQPADDVAGSWQPCSPASVKAFSAVEYFFGRNLLQSLHVPMGLIESDWGGTPAQSWTSRDALESDAWLHFILEDWDRALANYPATKQKYDAAVENWNKAAAEARAVGKTPPARPHPPEGRGHQNTPAGLYNRMIAPLTPYAVRGVIWYPGESNASEEHAWRYRRFGAMIEDWRNRWGEGDFPFYFVQLANYKTNGW
jgi:sialate O-acetylesterase